LPALLEQMAPMLPPRLGSGGRPRIGKYSFADALRAELFSFALYEIRKYDRRIRIALCKETALIWQRSGLDPDRCSCVCQLDDNPD
jgi:spore photoproduct lyase